MNLGHSALRLKQKNFMKKLRKGDIKKLRDSFKKDFRGEVVISMGTCGIAAGGNDVYELFKKELLEKGLDDIKLSKTGCLGMCFCEPNLIVKLDGMEEILYGNVNIDIATQIVNEHITRKRIVNNSVIFMPTEDIGRKLFKKEC